MSAPERIGRYRIDRRLGSGGFATVWLARDEVLQAPVAVKVLADNWAHQLDVRERFLEEARILRRADSDRVVRVHDIGELDDGRPYFVMTYADGGTLADKIAAGPVPVADALRYGADVARGLAVLHQVGVIHRDVNPANVLLLAGRDGSDRVLVADLGLAKAVAHGSGFTLTVGTPGYMAPEQSAGDGVSKRADVYAVGALLHHLLTGVAPVAGEPLQPPASLRAEVPAPVDAVVRQAVRRRPEERYPSAGALADALDAARIASAATPRRPAADPDATERLADLPAAPADDHPTDQPAAGRGSPRAGGAGRAAAAGGAGRGAAVGGAGRGAAPGSGAGRGAAGGPGAGRGTSAGRAGRGAAVGPGAGRGASAGSGAGRGEPPAARREAPSAAGGGAGPAGAGAGTVGWEPRAEPDDTMQLRRPEPARRRRRGRAVVLLGTVLLLLAGAAAGAALWIRSTGDVQVRGEAATVTVPRSWAGERRDGAVDGTTALIVAADADRWSALPSDTPGVRVAVGPSDLTGSTLLARSPAAGCQRTDKPWDTGGLTGTAHFYPACPQVGTAFLEAVLRASDGRTVFVQIKGDEATATAVLSSITVH
ncbi:MAG TPA: serine/threonine-protein kinase [Mycobacteriales bacterium]